MDFHEIAALVIFCAVVLLTVVLVLVPVTVQLPARWQHKLLPFRSISISYAAVPAVGTLVMLMTGVLDGSSLATGIVGDASMKPYGIVILFMALAYMSSSLDMTGCFQWFALHLTRMSRGNGLALFLLYYTLSSVITIFTSNDVSIMTLTPIIHYFALATGADPIPFLTAEFTAANIWSMLLFVGNPTNIIVAMAYRLSFLDYSKWMALPTIGAGFAALGAVLLVHWTHIPRHLELPDLQPAAMLVDKPGAILGSINILACLAFLAAAPALGWELWVVTLVCAVLHALYNLIAYVVLKGRWCTSRDGADLQQRTAAGPAAIDGAGRAAAAGADVKLQPQDNVPGCAHELELVQASSREALGAQPAAQHTWHQQQWQVETQKQEEEQFHKQQLYRSGGGDGPLTAGCPRPPPLPPDRQQSVASAAAVDAEVSIHDPELMLRSRSCSRQQLLSAQQHAACSDAAGLHGRVASCSGGLCQTGLQEGCSVSHKGHQQHSGRDLEAAAEASPATGSGGAPGRRGLKPPPAPNFWRAFTVLPWEIVPFVLGMFCVVEGLNANGWVDALAAWLARGLGGSVWGALFGVGGLSLLLANIINNQPMTILMTRVCMAPAFTQPLIATAAAAGTGHAAAVPLASAFAVVVASNTAANFSVMGALAGIMFVNILQQRGLDSLSYVQFSRLMLPAGIISTVVALLVLGAEFVTWRL